MVADVEQQDLSARRLLEKRRLELIGDDPRGTELASAERDADATIGKLAAAIEAAKAERQTLRATRVGFEAQRRGTLSNVEAELERTASPSIDLALARVDGIFEAARRTVSIAIPSRGMDGKLAHDPAAVADVLETRDRMGRIRAAREALRGLKLEAPDAAELRDRIASILGSIDRSAAAAA